MYTWHRLYRHTIWNVKRFSKALQVELKTHYKLSLKNTTKRASYKWSQISTFDTINGPDGSIIYSTYIQFLQEPTWPTWECPNICWHDLDLDLDWHPVPSLISPLLLLVASMLLPTVAAAPSSSMAAAAASPAVSGVWPPQPPNPKCGPCRLLSHWQGHSRQPQWPSNWFRPRGLQMFRSNRPLGAFSSGELRKIMIRGQEGGCALANTSRCDSRAHAATDFLIALLKVS